MLITTYWELTTTTGHTGRGSKRNYPALQQRVFAQEWSRVIFDECQELATLTNCNRKRLNNCLNVRHRWLVSGTPLYGNINNLLRLAQVLKLQPFSRETFHDEMTGKTDSTSECMPQEQFETAITSVIQKIMLRFSVSH